MGTIKTLAITVVAAAIGAGAFAYSGLYIIAADDPHSPVVTDSSAHQLSLHGG